MITRLQLHDEMVSEGISFTFFTGLLAYMGSGIKANDFQEQITNLFLRS